MPSDSTIDSGTYLAATTDYPHDGNFTSAAGALETERETDPRLGHFCANAGQHRGALWRIQVA